MSMEVDATYENGVLKLDHPLPIGDKQRVHVTVHPQPNKGLKSYGLIQWTGSDEDLDYLRGPENSSLEHS